MERARTVALVGCGNWGRHILRDLVQLGCQVPVVANDPATMARARELGAQSTVPTVAALPPVEGVVVATPTATHAEVVQDALALGVPVFVEKPLTADPASACRLAAAGDGRLFVMDKWRYHPGVRMLRDIARDGRLGPVVGLHTTRVGWGNPHKDVDIVWILAPHELAIGLEVLGALPLPRSAVADVEGGRVVGLTAMLGAKPWQVFDVSGRSERRSRDIRLHCRDGIAVLSDAYADHVLIHRDARAPEPRAERVPIGTDLPLAAELRAFVGHLEGGPPPASSAAEGAAIVQAIADLRALAGVA